jgi:aryl-alcohol dehydrogenase-like predicted oxidoreductase
LKANIASVDVTLPQAVLEGIEAIHKQHPNPAP